MQALHHSESAKPTTGLRLNRATQSAIVWAVVVLFVALQLMSAVPGVLSPTVTLVLFSFLLASLYVLHGTLVYRLRDLVAVAVIIIVVSNAFENLSILTGFPFGKYIYSDSLGPKVFNVPLVIGALYCAPGYFAWTLARRLLHTFGYRPRGSDVYCLPLVAAFAMAAWDMTMDPVRSTIQHNWIWTGGGAYFGVPFTNFLPGWLLVVWVLFQLVAVYLRIVNRSGQIQAVDRSFWYQAAGVYSALALGPLLLPFTQANVAITDPSGTTWMTGAIYQSTALVTIFTMVFIALLSALQTARE